MPPFTKSQYIWMNGSIMPWDDAQIHVSAHGLQYGTGVFEGMRSYDTPEGPAIFRLDAHMRRLKASAEHYEIDIPFSVEQLCEASLEVIRANGLENAYLRPIAFFDSYSFSVWPKDCPVTTAIIAVPGRAYLQGGPENGVRVQEAIRKGYDEAILLNNLGDVAEGSGANLFVVRNGTVITNDKDASIVMGITRDSVIQIVRDLGLPIEIRPISVADVREADELFFSGTAVEVTPIKSVDDRTLGDGSPGPITRRIQSTYFDAVHGRLAQYRPWLSFVGQMQSV
jgi:branched-chain amino acid aminotransferase